MYTSEVAHSVSHTLGRILQVRHTLWLPDIINTKMICARTPAVALSGNVLKSERTGVFEK